MKSLQWISIFYQRLLEGTRNKTCELRYFGSQWGKSNRLVELTRSTGRKLWITFTISIFKMILCGETCKLPHYGIRWCLMHILPQTLLHITSSPSVPLLFLSLYISASPSASSCDLLEVEEDIVNTVQHMTVSLQKQPIGDSEREYFGYTEPHIKCSSD